MSISLLQNVTAIGPGLTTSFLAVGGTSPYVYSVLAGGAGGTINSSTGIYTAASVLPTVASQSIDTIQAIDSLSAIATATILIGSPLELLCDILQNQLSLSQGRVYLWDQKINQPTDNGLYVAVSVPSCKPFGNDISYNGSGSGLQCSQSVYMQATVDIDIMSRGPAARDQKELVLMALNSVYSEQQQEANGFHISRLTSNFVNLSNIDGAAIPYRFKLTFRIQYAVTNNASVPYFSNFPNPSVVINS